MKTKILSLLISLSLLAVFCACTPREQHSMSPRETLSHAEELMQTRPDSALMLLEDLSKGALRGRENRAHFALLYSQALDKNYIDLANDSIIRIAVDYYAPRKDNTRKMLAYYYLGRVQYNAKEYQKAIVSLMQAEEAAKLSRDNFYLGLIYRSMSDIHSDIYNFTEALQYARNSYNSFTLSENQHYADWSLLDIGKAFHNSAQYDSSIVYTKSVIEIAKAHQDTLLLSDALQTIAKSYVATQKYKDAINSFQESLKLGNDSFSKNDLSMMGTAYHAVGDIEKANQCRIELLRIDSTETWLSYMIEKQCGDYQNALSALEAVISKSNYHLSKLIRQNVTQAINEYQLHKFQLQKKELQQAKLSRALLILSIIFCVVFIVLAAYIVRQRIKAKNLAIVEYMDKVQDLESELLVKERNLQAVSESNSQMNEQINLLFAKQFATIDQLSATYYEMHAVKNEKEAVYKSVKKEIENFSKNKKTLQELENIVNQHKNNVMAVLREEFPEFSEMDFRLICYSIAGFSAKAISVFTGNSTGNIYMKKSRLKAKINASDIAQKETIIKSLD